jgi:tryptophanyl-tRNA synthetase
MHALTVWQDPADLTRATRELTAAYLAAGIDPQRSIIFNQSRVDEHSKLAWIFNCVARMGWMNRMTQWKDKTAGKNAEAESLGLFAYPSLMAADILLYKATHVPVGEDQKQHLELTRDIAQKFNIDYAPRLQELGFGDQFFPLTEPLITGPATRVMSLRDGKKKMSKSDASEQSRILLMDDADEIARKIRRATTDPEPLPETVEGLKGRAEADNLVGIYAALADTTKDAVLQQYAGQGWGVFKPALAQLAVSVLAPNAERIRELLADPGQIDAILKDGADRARALAAPILADVWKIVGFVS